MLRFVLWICLRLTLSEEVYAVATSQSQPTKPLNIAAASSTARKALQVLTSLNHLKSQGAQSPAIINGRQFPDANTGPVADVMKKMTSLIDRGRGTHSHTRYANSAIYGKRLPSKTGVDSIIVRGPGEIIIGQKGSSRQAILSSVSPNKTPREAAADKPSVESNNKQVESGSPISPTDEKGKTEASSVSKGNNESETFAKSESQSALDGSANATDPIPVAEQSVFSQEDYWAALHQLFLSGDTSNIMNQQPSGIMYAIAPADAQLESPGNSTHQNETSSSKVDSNVSPPNHTSDDTAPQQPGPEKPSASKAASIYLASKLAAIAAAYAAIAHECPTGDPQTDKTNATIQCSNNSTCAKGYACQRNLLKPNTSICCAEAPSTSRQGPFGPFPGSFQPFLPDFLQSGNIFMQPDPFPNSIGAMLPPVMMPISAPSPVIFQPTDGMINPIGGTIMQPPTISIPSVADVLPDVNPISRPTFPQPIQTFQPIMSSRLPVYQQSISSGLDGCPIGLSVVPYPGTYYPMACCAGAMYSFFYACPVGSNCYPITPNNQYGLCCRRDFGTSTAGSSGIQQFIPSTSPFSSMFTNPLSQFGFGINRLSNNNKKQDKQDIDRKPAGPGECLDGNDPAMNPQNNQPIPCYPRGCPRLYQCQRTRLGRPACCPMGAWIQLNNLLAMKAGRTLMGQLVANVSEQAYMPQQQLYIPPIPT